MTVFCFFTSIIILALWIPTSSNVGELIFAPLFGFGSGAAIGLSPALIAQISPIKEIGTRTGLVFGIASIGALTGSPIGGALITREHGEFTYMQVFGGVVCFAGASFFLLARIKIGGWSYKIKV
jgi:MFS family permease